MNWICVSQRSNGVVRKFIPSLVICMLLLACTSEREKAIGEWTIPSHSHYFDIREDGGYEIQGVDGYRQTGEWQVENDLLLLLHRQGTDTLWFTETANKIGLEDRTSQWSVPLLQSEATIDIDQDHVLDLLLSDTLSLIYDGYDSRADHVVFHEDAFLDVHTGKETLWHLKTFRGEWFLATEGFNIWEYQRILSVSDDEIVLEHLGRDTRKLGKAYLRRR